MSHDTDKLLVTADILERLPPEAVEIIQILLARIEELKCRLGMNPQRSLAGIVCRLDIIVLQKRPQVVHAIQNVLAHAGVFAAQPKRSFFESCVHRPPQFSGSSG